MKKLTPIALALALAFSSSANASSAADMQKQIDMLKNQIAELQKMVTAQAQKQAAAPVAAAGDTELKAEVAAMRVKMDAMDDAQQESGFAGLKVSGFMDPTYIFNQRTGRGDFIFLNKNDAGDPNNDPSNSFGYTNANFGGATLKIEKTFDNEMSAVLKLRPYKSANNEWVEEAYAAIPMGGFNLVVGKRNSFNGYESVDSSEQKLVTHNLLYDFGGPLQMIGVGADFSALGMDWMTLAGNMNETRDVHGKENHNRGFHWRGDMEMSEYFGWGISGMHGTLAGEGYNYLDTDFWYTRGDLNINGQLEASKHQKMAYNGKDAEHWGASLLASYNMGDGWELVGRADYLDEHKNGGSSFRSGWDCPDSANFSGVTDISEDDGTGAAYQTATTCGDYASGFGPELLYGDPLALGAGDVWYQNLDKGAKRSSFTFGVNYMLNEWALLKLEVRHDISNNKSFYDWEDKSYKKSNTTFGAQTVVKF
jgi:hypothetical protein